MSESADPVSLGWMRRGDATHAWVLRVPHAYPVHDFGYAERLATVRGADASRWA